MFVLQSCANVFMLMLWEFSIAFRLITLMHVPLLYRSENQPLRILVFLKSFQFNEADELPTIDTAAFGRLSEVVEASEENTAVPLASTTPLNPSVTAPVVMPPTVLTVTHSQQSVSHEALEMEVGDKVVSSCVTPRKFLAVKDILQKEKKPHKCALKLLPYFFTSAELSSSNTDGTHNKLPLDSTRLNSLKVLVFSRFPVESTVEKEKSWKSIKGKINGKCRLTKHIHKQAGETRDK